MSRATSPNSNATQYSIGIAPFVIPVKAGIQALQCILDPGLRRGDGIIGHPILWCGTRLEVRTWQVFIRKPLELKWNRRGGVDPLAKYPGITATWAGGDKSRATTAERL
jgi:hypothetical protein